MIKDFHPGIYRIEAGIAYRCEPEDLILIPQFSKGLTFDFTFLNNYSVFTSVHWFENRKDSSYDYVAGLPYFLVGIFNEELI